jgi:hypothetical protein
MSDKKVTFEQAVKLKEMGFDEPCKYYYDLEFKESTFHVGDVGDTYKNSEITNGYGKEKFPMVSSPTLNEVVDWFLKVHSVWIFTYPVAPYVFDDEDYPKVVWVSKICSMFQVNFDRFIDADNGLAVNHHHTPDDAISAAIDHMLKVTYEKNYKHK